jgi:hypothetical protein
MRLITRCLLLPLELNAKVSEVVSHDPSAALSLSH